MRTYNEMMRKRAGAKKEKTKSEKEIIIQKLSNWSENAILCAELEGNGLEANPRVELLQALIAEASLLGMSLDEIGGLVWYPYSDEVK